MSRGLYGEAVLTPPVTEEILETIKTGDYYLVDEQ
jgi:hypothetical protein